MTERKSLDDWKEHIQNILEQTAANVQESEADRKKRRSELEANAEAWFGYYFPQYAYAQPADFHTEATRRVLENPEHYEVRMWSRELAKSTRTMMEVLYLILVGHPLGRLPGLYIGEHGIEEKYERQKKKYVLLVSNSLDNAVRLLMPYKANLEYNKRIIADYGPQESPGKWQAAEFTTISGAAFRALGAGQSPRGARNEDARPDMLLFDDVDTDADCLNPSIIAQKWRWIEEAAIGTRSISCPTTIIFCGNRIGVDCCIERARTFADHCETINIRDGTGRSVWPAKNTEADIDRVLRQKSYAAAQKEYFNNPITEGAVFGEMNYKPVKPIKEYDYLVCYTDPSYKDTNDYKATVLVGYRENEFHIIKCFLEQTTTAHMLDWHKQLLQLTHGTGCTYYMEEVFMQDVIRKELNESSRKSGIPLWIKGDKRKKQDKYTRIETVLEPLHRNGRLYLNEHERYNPHMLRLAQQFKAFAARSNAHDDGPDAVEGAVWKINEKILLNGGHGIIVSGAAQKRNNYL